MIDVKQATRGADVSTPLGPDALALTAFDISERMDGPFVGDLELISADFEIAADEILGEPLVVRFDTETGERLFHGFAHEFEFVGALGRLARYVARIRPWTDVINHRTNCRIFQEMSAIDIVRQVVDEAGFSDALDVAGLSATYTPREYCVQYNEGDFDFVARLLEEEGVSYFFRHGRDRHTLVLADWPDALSSAPGYERVPYYPENAPAGRDREHVFEWRMTSAIRAGAVAMRDYDFAAPKKDLAAQCSEAPRHAHGSKEAFAWPGGYFDLDSGTARARARLETLRGPARGVTGRGCARGLSAGFLFELENFPRADQNGPYRVAEVTHRYSNAEYETGVGGLAGAAGDKYECVFSCQRADAPMRPRRTTPRPRVLGPQTATVVGPAGEEIWTDEHGRVKVQFHWDRLGRRDENASCWIRVAQPWAHKGWGWQHVPRIGQEVVVLFLEGDPDRPIVAGALYNGDNAPPFSLPGDKTQSGVRSNSSIGGGGSNEIRFEDKKGSEQIYIHAQKDEDIVVENNATRTVGVDRTKSIGNNETSTIGVDRMKTVGANETTNIGANRTETVGANEQVTIAIARTHNVGATDTLNVGAAQAVNVGAAQAITVVAARAVSVGAAQQHTIGGVDSTSVGASQSLDVGGARTTTVGGPESKSVGESLTITVAKDWAGEAGDSIVLKTGKSSLTMKQDGTIILKGKDITIDASGDVAVKSSKDTSIKAGGNVVVKGTKVLNN